MSTARTAFVTGGTGFLGSFLITSLLRKGYRVVALVRGPDPAGRLLEMLHEIDEGEGEEIILGEQLQVVEGDIRTPGFGLLEETQRGLAHEVEEIWHCAASFKFQERYREEIVAHNITGMRHLLDFARLCNVGKVAPLFSVSTAYAAPLIAGRVREELPPTGTPFRNLYEWSKQEAERLVYRFRQEYHLPMFIFRPSIIIGHARTGRAVRFTGYYDVIRAIYLLTHCLEVNLGANFDRNLRLRILAGQSVRLNVVPVDFVVAAMWQIARAAPSDSFIFNLTSDFPAPLADLFHQACVPLAVTGIELVEEDAFRQQPMTGLERIFNRKTQFQAPYLLDGPLFDNTNFRRVVPQTALPCPRIDEELLHRVNSYYYREVLDRQFGIQHTQSQVPTSVVFPSPHSALRTPQLQTGL